MYMYIYKLRVPDDPTLIQAQDDGGAEDLVQTFGAMDWGDLWHDAMLVDAVVYTRGATGLRIPDQWRHVLPMSL